MTDYLYGSPRELLCPDCGHHLHRPNPGVCQWRDCICGAMAEDRVPTPEVVNRIVAHLWGEDIVNIRAAVESFGNGWTVVPKRSAQSAPPLDRTGRKLNGQCAFCRSFGAHLDGCPALQPESAPLHDSRCPVYDDENALCSCHVIRFALGCGCVLIKRPHVLLDHWQPES